MSPRSVSPTVASRPQGGGSATVDRSRATHAKEHLGPLECEFDTRLAQQVAGPFRSSLSPARKGEP